MNEGKVGFGIGWLCPCPICGHLTTGMAILMSVIKLFSPAPHQMVSSTQPKGCPNHATRILGRSV